MGGSSSKVDLDPVVPSAKIANEGNKREHPQHKKLSKLVENLEFLIAELVKAKPASAKGKFLKKISVSSTMGPSLVIDGTSYI